MHILSGKTILITGGTGSFGRHFTRRVLKDGNPRSVRIFSRDELKQHDMSLAIKDERLRFLIGDVRDKDRLGRAVEGVDIVVHAAALKQVPACEYNPFEAVQTNILGTQNVADVCIDAGVKSAIALSTDKAVSPINFYGATKLCAEKLFVHANSYAGDREIRLGCVRYGNVVGSRGSVVPIFQEQAVNGELTITDKEMTRFWISLDQAIDLVVLALTSMSGGEVFIPKVPSMRIVDLAEVVAPGVPHRYTGVRPGEKIHESLITADESRLAFEYDSYFILLPAHPHWNIELPPGGHPVSEGFHYGSNTNSQWLDAAGLRTVLASQNP